MDNPCSEEEACGRSGNFSPELPPLSCSFWVLLNGGNRYYGRSGAAEEVEVYILIGMALLSILLPLGYFCGRCIYAHYQGKSKKSG